MISIRNTSKKITYLLTAFILIFLGNACTKNLQEETVVFKDNFEGKVSPKIHNAVFSKYNGSTVLGRYHTAGFHLFLGSLPPHDLIQVSFDLYIHDNWRGNSLTGVKEDSDIWIMDFDGRSEKYTTFSNGQNPLFQNQSYPNNYPFQNNPAKTNAIKTDLPGACDLKNVAGGTTKYKITRTTYHSADTLQLICGAQLYAHKNSTNPICEASWSVDNLLIKTIRYRD